MVNILFIKLIKKVIAKLNMAKVNIAKKRLKVFRYFTAYFLFDISLTGYVINEIIGINEKLINEFIILDFENNFIFICVIINNKKIKTFKLFFPETLPVIFVF